MWDVFETFDGSAHTVPENDLIGHVLTEDCICGPTVLPVEAKDGSIGWVYSHYSLDNREEYE